MYLPRIPFIVVAVLVSGITVCGQRLDLKFDRFNTQSGLLKNFVANIVQDHRGLMWFGTENGLNKFDGYNFVAYQHNSTDDRSLRSNSVLSLYEDRRKNLWVGTSKGLHLYDRKNNNFIRYGDLLEAVEAVYEDRINNLWIATSTGEVYQVDRDSGKFSLFGEPSKEKFAVGSHFTFLDDSEGTLWFGSERALHIIDRSKRTITIKDINVDKVTCIFEDHNKDLWFTSLRQGVNRYERKTNKWQRFQHDANDPNSLSDNTVFCITEDHQGRLWIGTDHNGLDILDRDRH